MAETICPEAAAARESLLVGQRVHARGVPQILGPALDGAAQRGIETPHDLRRFLRPENVAHDALLSISPDVSLRLARPRPPGGPAPPLREEEQPPHGRHRASSTRSFSHTRIYPR